MTSETLCPRCKNGHVIEARVIATGYIIHICNECEAVWFCKNSIHFATFNYFNVYMERLSLPDDWDQLEYPLTQSDSC
jgi:hypothetical protein